MILLPRYKCVLNTVLPPEDAGLSLGKLVNNERPIFKRMYANDEFSKKPFCGVISGHDFKISRIISYGNPVLPVIKGSIKKTQGGSQIEVFMRLSRFMQIVFFMWVIVGLLMCLIAQSFVPILMVVLGYICITIPFGIEVRKNTGMINECLETK